MDCIYICAADIQNACIQAPTSDKNFALNGGKSAELSTDQPQLHIAII